MITRIPFVTLAFRTRAGSRTFPFRIALSGRVRSFRRVTGLSLDGLQALPELSCITVDEQTAKIIQQRLLKGGGVVLLLGNCA